MRVSSSIVVRSRGSRRFTSTTVGTMSSNARTTVRPASARERVIASANPTAPGICP
jgi:hypothetical protein